jgi:superfamily II DNA/RNA helicase
MALIIGGESMVDQVKKLDRGVDVLIATPGRLLDMFERGGLLLRDVKILVIDEADRMLDMGFIPDVERIVSLLPPIRQTLFFSATMPPEIRRLADAFLMNPKEITVAPPATPAATVMQRLAMVRHEGRGHTAGGHREKRAALRALLRSENPKNALIFCNRKRDVGIVCRSLERHGFNVGQLHGDMSQPARTETLDAFKRGDIRLLVCSDVAARGLDIQDMSHVFNFDVPIHSEDYVHRIGRTGRAGREGRAFTIATPEDGKHVAAIERLIGKEIPRVFVEGIEPASETATEVEAETAEPRRERRGRGRGRGRERERERGHGRDREIEHGRERGPHRERERGREHEAGRDRRRDRSDDKPVIGMGDHVPAFLLRPTGTRKG